MPLSAAQLKALDTPVHKGQRRRMVEELQNLGISNEQVLIAMGKIPRHLFIDSAFWQHAYQNKAFRIASGQTLSHPYTVARQSELLFPFDGEKVLEIGTGSGYQAAVLLEMGAQLTSLEIVPILSQKANTTLQSLGYKGVFLNADGSKGYEASAPYHKVILTCGAEMAPEPLLNQLAIGGNMVIPLGDKEIQQMHRIKKISQDEFSQEIFEAFSFVPLTGKFGWRT